MIYRFKEKILRR